MPFLQLHTTHDLTPGTRAALGFALADAYATTMQTDRRIVTVGIVRYAEGDLVRYGTADRSAHGMTVVTCDGRTGRDDQTLESLGREITNLISQHLGVDPLRVAVYVTEHPSHQIYRDGGPAPSWSPSEAGNEPSSA